MTKITYIQPIPDIFNGERVNAFSLKLGRGQKNLLLPLWLKRVLEVLASNMGRQIKDIQITKEKIKLSFSYEMIWYIGNPKESKKQKHLELISQIVNVTGYKMNV